MIEQRRHQWRSLAGGEVSEEMYGRVDLPRHAIALKRCYNAVVTPQGAVENRAGSRFITPTNNNQPAWLVPFVRSDGQGFLLEFGDETLRVVGGGNVINQDTDPGDTFDVIDVDIWVEADGLPITPVVFTTDAPHGFVAGDAIQFQGFSLVNPDQAGIDQLAQFMNTTWYVFSVPTTDTFTIIDHWPPISATWNYDFELGTGTQWAFGPSGLAEVTSAAPVQTGTYSLKLQRGSHLINRALSEVLRPVTPGQEVSLSAWVQSNGGTPGRLQLTLTWLNSVGAGISEVQLTPDPTLVSGLPRITADAPGVPGGITSEATDAVWTEIGLTAIAPSNAVNAYFDIRVSGGTVVWAIDDVTLDTGPALWDEFSYAPYFGLMNGGTVALANASAPVFLAPDYSWSHIRFASFAQFVDDLVIAHKLYPTAKLTRVSDNEWTFTAVVFNVTLAAPANVTATPQGTPGSPAITYTYTVTATNEDNAESAPGTPDTADNTLRTLGNFNVIAWDTVATTFRYNIYKGIGSGSVHGYIGSATGLTFTDDNISPDFLKQPAEIIASFGAPGDYPGTVCFFEQRMVLAGTTDEPQAFWASGLPAFDYFKASTPPQDDQAFTFELMSRKAAPILHSLADPELLFFTSAGVQRVIPVEGELFTPTTVGSRTASAFGAHELAKPQEAGTNVLYPIERGAHLYELKPSDTGYESNDLSVIAAHLIDNKDWVQTAFRRSPFPVWLGVRNDGIIVGLTYMPEQQVYAWHQHELPGAFVESIAVVPEGKVDSIYVVARRTIGGNTVRYIERIEHRNFGPVQADAFFVDSGITYRGASTSVVAGLDHLEGEDVMVLADGRVGGPYTVEGGEISIDVAAAVIHVGLSYTTEVETLPLAYTSEAGYGLGIMKNVSQLILRLKQSLGLTAGPSFTDEDQRPLADDAEELLGAVPALRDGPHDVTLQGQWTTDSTVCIKQTQPLPMTITALSADYVDG
jgi:hypothetical protein